MADNEVTLTEDPAKSDAVNQDAVRNATRDAIAKQTNSSSAEDAGGGSQVDDEGKNEELTTTSKSTDADGEEPSKRLSGYKRLKNRHELTIAENEALKAEIKAIKEGTSTSSPEPKMDDFDDPDDFQAALIKHTVKSTVQEVFREEKKSAREAESQVHRDEAEDEFMQQVSEVKSSYDDFDQAMESLGKSVGTLNEGVTGMLMDSDKGALILRYLGKNPKEATRINQLGIIELSREIGKLEATLSMPQRKLNTNAPPPINPPRGGGDSLPPTNLAKIAQGDDMGAYRRAREKQKAG